jgi:hypothetical protein
VIAKKGMHSVFVLQLLFCVVIANIDGTFMIAKKRPGPVCG